MSLHWAQDADQWIYVVDDGHLTTGRYAVVVGGLIRARFTEAQEATDLLHALRDAFRTRAPWSEPEPTIERRGRVPKRSNA